MLLALQFIKNHWKGLSVLLVVALAFFGGRFSVPDKPAKVVSETHTEYKDRIVTVEKQVEGKRVVVYRDRVTKPDGTKIEHEVERSDSTVVSTKDVVDTKDAKEDRRVTVEASKPQWRVGVLAGVDLRSAKLLPTPDLGKPVVGAEVQRRILGGFSLGAWGLSSGEAGLSLSYEF